MNAHQILEALAPLELRGNHLVVHSSLSAFGKVEGGPITLCRALCDAVTPMGTILMPAFTYATLAAPQAGEEPVPYRRDLPVSAEIGCVPEAFRKLPGVRRSSHPTHSFAAWGRLAEELLAAQRDNNPFGPLKKLYLLHGHVLLLGTFLFSATAIHLAEEWVKAPYLGRCSAWRINQTGNRERAVLENVPGCSAAFARLESRLDPELLRTTPLPSGRPARKIPIRYLVRLALDALRANPAIFVCDNPACRSCAEKKHALGLHGAQR